MNIVENFISLIAPHKCIVCGLEGDTLCQPCLITSLAPPPSRCYRCHSTSIQSSVCQICRKTVKLQHVWVASDYQDTAKELIRRLKFERASAAAIPVASAIIQALPDLPPDTVVSYVPTANNRVRLRGYDQAKLIAENIARQRNWQHQSLLMRTGSTRQVGAGRVERFKQIEASLIAIKISKIKQARILLIDDVTTTGATLEAAAAILKSSGAHSIDAAVFAQPI
jgi:competence protein ComFC